MSTKLLLPNSYKLIGWFLLIPSVILRIITSSGHDKPSWISWFNVKVFAIFSPDYFGFNNTFGFIETNITDTVIGVLFIVGAMLVSFSKEKKEDEFIAKLRLSSLLWAVFVNYTLLLFAFIFVYNNGFFTVMIYNMFTVLIIFILRFNYILYKNSKPVPNEK